MNYLFLFFIAVITSAVNILAGGGSFITIPFLIFMGLPPTVANATNRVGILAQTFVAFLYFNKRKLINIKKDGTEFAIPALIGAILGSIFASLISDANFKKYLIFFMLFFVFLSLINMKNNINLNITNFRKFTKIKYFIFFLIGIYGGFIQAGVGFFIIGALSLFNYNLSQINIIKSFIILLFTVISLLIFTFSVKIDLLSGGVLACGNIFGAYLGSYINVSVNLKILKGIVLIAILIFSILLLIF
ncbi:MAG: sulfite exporter TauE/SafE family protein [Deferribacterota bacterium]|nr:sulfite exporter TauE/SafE family protein [Deferribacterota bacterium]